MRWLRAGALGCAALAVVIGGLVGSAFANDSSVSSTVTRRQLGTSVLAVANASGGTYDGKHLVLTGVQPAANWFSDRPVRQAGSFDVPTLINVFFKDQVPPNAALTFTGAPASDDVALVEISHATYQSAQRRLTFDVRLLPRVNPLRLSRHPNLADFAARNDAKIPRHFDASALFLDGAPAAAVTYQDPDVQYLVNEYNVIYPQMSDTLINLIKLNQEHESVCLVDLQIVFEKGYTVFLGPVTANLKTLENEPLTNGAGELLKTTRAQLITAQNVLNTAQAGAASGNCG